MTTNLSDVLTPEELETYSPDFENTNYISRLHKTDSAHILTLRELEISENSLKTKSRNFILKDDLVYRCAADSLTCELLEGGHQNLFVFVNETQKKNNKILSLYSEQIDILEDLLYDRDIPRHFMDMWFDQKKSMLKIERYFARLYLVLKEYWDEFSGHTSEFSENTLEKIQFDLGQTGGMIAKLETIHHYYTSVKNDKLNKNIYILTLISGIFLPLNLIVGFFGMNTENLIFKDHPEGTLFVIYLLAGVLVFSTIGLKMLRIVDHFLLKYGLGRIKFYKVLSQRLQQMEKSFELD